VAAEPAAVEQIITGCARLPLALVIVAARAAQNAFPLAGLAAELTGTGTRLVALDAGDPLTRVRSVFSWSYRALTGPAARLFRLLGLHPGPHIAVTAAASLAGVPPVEAGKLLTELAGCSLISEPVPGRYAQHDLLAVYATELTAGCDSDAERAAATTRLVDHYAYTAHAADGLLSPPRDPIALPLGRATDSVAVEPIVDERAAMAWFRTEHAALTAVLRLAATAGFEARTWQLAWVLNTFLHRHGYQDDRAAAWQLAVAAADRLDHPQAAAYAYRDLAWASIRLGRYDQARSHLHRALGLHTRSRDPIGQAHTHRALASLAERAADLHQALEHDKRALTLYRAAGHDQGQADALNSIGWDHALLGEHTAALDSCRRALALHERAGDRSGQANTWDSLGYIHHNLAEYEQALGCYRKTLALVRDLGDPYHEADTLNRVADTHLTAGNPTAARNAWARALAILTDLDHPDAAKIRASLAELSPKHATGQASTPGR
jgi:tetratricopeptide (TPR) repeat protein